MCVVSEREKGLDEVKVSAHVCVKKKLYLLRKKSFSGIIRITSWGHETTH